MDPRANSSSRRKDGDVPMSDAMLLVIVAGGMIVAASIVAALRAATGKQRSRTTISAFDEK